MAAVELPTGTITFMLTDIESSTARWDRNPQAMTQALVRHDAVATQLIAENGGRQVEAGREGDSILAVFTRASDALACAIALQSALGGEMWPEGADLRVRIALHSGEAELRAGHYYGAALYRANRILATANGGQIVMTRATHSLVVDSLPESATLRDLGEHRLKDLDRPEHVFQVVHPSFALDDRPLKSAGADRHNLPAQSTRFVGREGQLTELKRLLSSSRMLTLTGPGGAGKTRLALQAALEVLPQFPDGVWRVELASLTDEELIPQAVAQALGVIVERGRPVTETLTAWLRARRLLLVLDNCEHLTAATAAFTEQMLAEGPELTVMATSRERLKVPAEVAWLVPPMTVPADARDVSPEALLQFEAVILFTDRALASQPDFELTEQNVRTVTEICRRLDGLPLSIELAAARVNVMSPAEILPGLTHRLRLLGAASRTGGSRQRTLRGTLDWSYQLLEPDEAALFRRLSVFAGGFSLEAAEAVWNSDDEARANVLDLISRLVDKSLVVVRQRGPEPTRYSFLETVEEYARERLIEAGEQNQSHEAHAEYFLRLAERAATELTGPQSADWLRRIDLEVDNVRAVFNRELGREAEMKLRLATALAVFWDEKDLIREGRSRMASVLDSYREPTHLRASALQTAGMLAWAEGDHSTAEELTASALATRQELGDRAGVVRSLEQLAQIAFARDDYGSSREFAERGLSLAGQLADGELTARCLFRLAMAEMYQDDDPAARGHVADALKGFELVENDRLAALALMVSGQLALRRGDLGVARASFQDSLERQRSRASSRLIANLLDCFAELAAEQKDSDRALRLAGAAAALRQRAEHVPIGAFQREVSARIRAASPNPESDPAWRQGAQMTRPQAIELALRAGAQSGANHKHPG